MTSKEALKELFNEANRLSSSKQKYTTLELFEFSKIIEKDLEILKKHFYEEYKITSGPYSLLFRLNGTNKYEKIKEWLENE